METVDLKQHSVPLCHLPKASIPFQTRLANRNDIFKIMELYLEVYAGAYRDPLMNDFMVMKSFIENKNNFWFLGCTDDDLIASVVVRYDPENLLAKAFGAVVCTDYRRHGLMEHLLSHAITYVQSHTKGVDALYATTRTIHEGAQALTDRLGFKKLGIFPNSHKNVDYETHCLASAFSPAALTKRVSDYKLHAKLKRLVDIVSEEIPEVKNKDIIIPEPPTRSLVAPPALEMIESVNFVRFRYETLKKEQVLQFAFFPFHEPNVMILSPDQSVEIFCYHSRADGYSVILGGKVGDNISYTLLFKDIANLLREHQARYIETILRADKPKIIDSILQARFIPSAFFPAFQLHNGKRYDYVIMSKTFEVFDFQNIRLKGLNQKYLEAYYLQWKQSSLNPNLLDL